MERTIERPNPTQIVISARVPWAELLPLLKPAAERISAEADIEGFRKGKAPYEVVKAKFGEFEILEHAARIYIKQNFTKILEEVKEKEFTSSSFEPVGEPQVVVTKLALGEELEFRITLALLPPLELPDYQAIAQRILATRRVAETSAEEVSAAIEWLRESRATMTAVSRGAQTGDRVEIDFTARVGGVPVEGGQSRNHPFILGRGRFLPGFESALIGMKAGEEKSFSVAVPAGYRDAAIAGKVVEFATKMNLVEERHVPEWNDEFAASLGKFASAAEAEASVADGLRREKEEKERERLRMAMADAIAGETRVEIPDALIERELEKMTAELKDSIVGAGLKFDDYLVHIRKTERDLAREWRGDAERRVKIALVLREIARREHIAATAEDVEQAVNRTLAHRGMTEAEAKALDREAVIGYHTGIARNENVFKFLEHLEPQPRPL